MTATKRGASRAILERGQVPLDDLVDAGTVLAVRTLRPCAHCKGLGNSPSMVEVCKPRGFSDWYHARCYAAAFGDDALVDLPNPQRDGLMLGDLGVRLAKLLSDTYDARKAAKSRAKGESKGRKHGE